MGNAMRFDVNDPKFKSYAVYLDGQIEKSAIEADDSLGWVRTKKVIRGWFARPYEKRETKYGKVHIVRMEGFDLEHYRHKDLIPQPEDKDLLSEHAGLIW